MDPASRPKSGTLAASSPAKRARVGGALSESSPSSAPSAAAAAPSAGPVADDPLGEALVDALPIVARAGFAAELSRCRFLCGETFRLREVGATAQALDAAIERQCGARAARAAPRSRGTHLPVGSRRFESVDGATQLVCAAALGDDVRVRALVALGAPLDCVDAGGRSALWWSARNGHRRILEALVELAPSARGGSGAAPDPPAQLRGSGGGAGAGASAKGPRHCTALSLWSQRGDEAAVRVLLRAGARPDAQDAEGKSSLMFAPFAAAAAGGIARALLAAGADPALRSRKGRTALHYAANRGAEAVVRELLAAPAAAGVDAVDEDGRCALSHAAEADAAGVARLLLDAGASPGLADASGHTPLMVWAAAGNAEVVRMLAARGASLDARNGEDGRCALHLAAMRGNAGAARALIEAGAALDALDVERITPLMWASYTGSAAVTQMLLDAGAATGQRSVGGRSALRLAQDEGRAAVVALLRARGVTE